MTELSKSTVSGIQKNLREEQNIPNVHITGILDAATQEGYQFFLQNQGIGYPHYLWFPQTYEELHPAMKEYLNLNKIDINSDEILKTSDEGDDSDIDDEEDEDEDLDLDEDQEEFGDLEEVIESDESEESNEGEAEDEGASPQTPDEPKEEPKKGFIDKLLGK